jgi:hypothetical protein
MMMTMDFNKTIRHWNNQIPDSDIDWSVFENAGRKINFNSNLKYIFE